MMNPMGGMYPKPMPVSAGKIYPADQPMVNTHLFTMSPDAIDKRKNFVY